MSADLDWTTDLGDAEVKLPAGRRRSDPGASVEGRSGRDAYDDRSSRRVERHKASAPTSGRCASVYRAQAAVSDISIQPTDPSIVYVPTYDLGCGL